MAKCEFRRQHKAPKLSSIGKYQDRVQSESKQSQVILSSSSLRDAEAFLFLRLDEVSGSKGVNSFASARLELLSCLVFDAMLKRPPDAEFARDSSVGRVGSALDGDDDHGTISSGVRGLPTQRGGCLESMSKTE